MMKRNNNNPIGEIGRCFMEMDLHKARIENTTRQDIMIIFGGLKQYI